MQTLKRSQDSTDIHGGRRPTEPDIKNRATPSGVKEEGGGGGKVPSEFVIRSLLAHDVTCTSTLVSLATPGRLMSSRNTSFARGRFRRPLPRLLRRRGEEAPRRCPDFEARCVSFANQSRNKGVTVNSRRRERLAATPCQGDELQSATSRRLAPKSIIANAVSQVTLKQFFASAWEKKKKH